MPIPMSLTANCTTRRHPAGRSCGPQRDRAFLGELDRVVQKIDEDLLKAPAIRGDRLRYRIVELDLEAKLFGIGLCP